MTEHFLQRGICLTLYQVLGRQSFFIKYLKQITMKVKNKEGTKDLKCYCASWLAHWERFSGQIATYCKEVNCWSRDLVGSHVIKVDSNDQKTYIVPLCKAHNKSTEEIEIGTTTLVSANVQETCGRI